MGSKELGSLTSHSISVASLYGRHLDLNRRDLIMEIQVAPVKGRHYAKTPEQVPAHLITSTMNEEHSEGE